MRYYIYILSIVFISCGHATPTGAQYSDAKEMELKGKVKYRAGKQYSTINDPSGKPLSESLLRYDSTCFDEQGKITYSMQLLYGDSGSSMVTTTYLHDDRNRITGYIKYEHGHVAVRYTRIWLGELQYKDTLISYYDGNDKTGKLTTAGTTWLNKDYSFKTRKMLVPDPFFDATPEEVTINAADSKVRILARDAQGNITSEEDGDKDADIFGKMRNEFTYGYY